MREMSLTWLMVLLAALLIPTCAEAAIVVSDVETGGGTITVSTTFEVTCLVRTDDDLGPNMVSLHVANVSATMYPEGETRDWTTGVLYRCEISVHEPGDHRLTISAVKDGTRYDYQLNITVREKGSDGKKDDILGLPRWYCSASIILLTIFVMFLTFAYFKGRSIQKALMEGDGRNAQFCSSCAHPLKGAERSCPKCGSSIEGEVELCGKCRSVLAPGTDRCRRCGSTLRERQGTITEAK